MWKKEEGQTAQPPESTPRVSTPAPRAAQRGTDRATIGPSISIRGDVTGSEDLFIEGKIEGSVSLADHAVGVGSEGRVNADIVGRLITVEGRVEGDLTAQEQIILRGTAHVKGDIKAPRVVLEDGATFRGLVDMGSDAAKKEATSSEKASKSGNGATSTTGADAKSETTSKSDSSKSDSSKAQSSSSPKSESSSKSATSSGSSGSSSSSVASGSSSSGGKASAKSADQARA